MYRNRGSFSFASANKTDETNPVVLNLALYGLALVTPMAVLYAFIVLPFVMVAVTVRNYRRGAKARALRATADRTTQ